MMNTPMTIILEKDTVKDNQKETEKDESHEQIKQPLA